MGEYDYELLQISISKGAYQKGTLELTQSITASKDHLTHIASVGFLPYMGAFMIGKFDPVPESFTTMSARKRVVCEDLATAKIVS